METARLAPCVIATIAAETTDYRLMHPVFTEAYFIHKFLDIPAKKWCTYSLEWRGCHCALGWCGVKQNLTNEDFDLTEEAIELELLVRVKTFLALGDGRYLNVSTINDGHREAERLGNNPRERILKVLSTTPETLKELLTDETTTYFGQAVYV